MRKMGRWKKSLTKAILAVTGLIYLFSVLLMNSLPVSDLHVTSNVCCNNLSLNLSLYFSGRNTSSELPAQDAMTTVMQGQGALTTLSAEDQSITTVTATRPSADKLTHKIALVKTVPSTGQRGRLDTTNSSQMASQDLQKDLQKDLYAPNKLSAWETKAGEQSESKLHSADDAKVLAGNSAGHPGGRWREEWSLDTEREGGWARQLINQEGLCLASEDLPQGPYLLILVQSNYAQSAQRNAIRDTWGRVRNDFTSARHVVVVFLLGAPNDTDFKAWDSVHKESKMYRDILLWNIGDGHHNHTVKSILGLLWSFEYCPQAKYVLKTADDIYLNVSAIVEYLSGLWASKYSVTGHVETNGKPPHCSGAAYVVGMDFVRGVNRFLYNWISTYINATLPEEDVYVTATLAGTLGRQCRHERRFPTHETMMNAEELCRLLSGDLFGVHGVTFQMMYLIWKATQENWDCGQRPEALQDWLAQQYQYLNLYEEVEDGFTGG